MHRFFNTPELLDLTVRRLPERRSLYALAQTCRSLKDTSLDALWANLDSIVPLLLLLRPLKLHGQWSSDSKRWVFDTGPGQATMLTLSDWDVFLKYNYRVRKLLFSAESVTMGQSTQYELATTIFNELALTRPPDCPLLPNLRTLKIIVNIPSYLHLHAILFCHSRIQHLHIEYNITQPAIIQHTFKDIVSRTPNITLLTFGSVLPIEAVQIVTPISKLKHLKEITLPRGYVTTDMLGALANSENLRKISAYKNFVHRPQRTQALPTANAIDITQGAFQNITKLSIYAPLEALMKITEVEWASELRELELAVESTPNDTGDVGMLLEALARSRPLLSHLRLDNSWNTEASNAISFNTLRPLMGLTNIRTLVIRHPAGLSLDELGLTQLLSCWPRLIHLNLCADPFKFGPRSAIAGIPWELLGLFATCCPNIQHVGFPFTSSSPITDMGGQWAPLERLQSINVGLSDVAEPFELACFLANVCNSHTTLQAFEYASLVPHDIIPAEENQRREKWRQTERMARHMAALREKANVEKANALRELKRQLGIAGTWSQGAQA